MAPHANSETAVYVDQGDGLVVVLRELADAGLDAAMQIVSITRVSRLAPEDLRRSLDEIYRSRYGDYLRFATARLRNREDAEDVVNESFVRVLRADPDLTAPEALAGYVRRTVENETNRRLSTVGRDRERRARIEPAELERILQDTARPLIDRISDRVTIAVAMATLPHRQRQVMALRYLEDVSVSDTAELIGIAPGTVKSTLADGRRRLLAALAEPPLRIAG